MRIFFQNLEKYNKKYTVSWQISDKLMGFDIIGLKIGFKHFTKRKILHCLICIVVLGAEVYIRKSGNNSFQ